MHVSISTVGADLTGKNNYLILSPLLVSRQSGQCEALEAGCFGLDLVPGAEILLYNKVSIELTYGNPGGNEQDGDPLATRRRE